jgi:hypothetical protein
METLLENLNAPKHKSLPLSERIFYTLTENDETKTNQTARTLGLLVENLVRKGILLETDIHELFFDVSAS